MDLVIKKNKASR